MAYQPGIPTGSVGLNQDYLNVQENFGSLNTQWLVDHVPLTDTSGTPPNGYHTFVHLVPFSTPTTNPPNNYPIVTGVNGPNATAGYGQLFGATVNDGQATDSSLYYLSGGGLLTQLTRNIQPLAATNGYTYLPGGLLLQWGVHLNNVVPFNIAFSAVFSVNVTSTSKAITTPPAVIAITLGTPGSFTCQDNGGDSFNIYWIAIGK